MLTKRCRGAEVQQRCRGTEVPGEEVHRCRGAEVQQRYREAEVQRCRDADIIRNSPMVDKWRCTHPLLTHPYSSFFLT